MPPYHPAFMIGHLIGLDCQRIIVVDAQLRSKREQHASVVLLGQLFLLGGGWETKTIEVTISLGGRLGDQDH